MALTILSATVQPDGMSTALVFSTAHGPVNPGTGALTFAYVGTLANITSVSITATTGILFHGAPIYQTDAPTLQYTQGNVYDSDSPPVYLASFNGFPVINNSQVQVPTTTGFWTSQALIERYLGKTLADQNSNLDNLAAGADPLGFADMIAFAEDWLNSELALNGIASGVTTPTFPTTHAMYARLSHAATMLAAYWGYTKRGMQDNNDKPAGKFNFLKDRAEAIINDLLFLNRGNLPRVAGWADAPVAVTPSVDPSGNPVASRAPYPVPAWNGYTWVWK